MASDEPREWLIRKDGYYYRPNCQGYTTRKVEAGRYTKQKADAEVAVEPWHMSAIHQDEVPDEPVVAAFAARIAALEAELAEARAERDAARKGVSDITAAAFAVERKYQDEKARATAAEARAEKLAEALDLRKAVSAAALTWCGEKERETFQSDVDYFEHNWRALPGLTAYVDRELGKRARAALGRPE